MVIEIKVEKLGCGRAVAKVMPAGPVVEAQDEDTAIQFAKTAHASFLRTRNQWLPPDAWDQEHEYRVVP